MSEGGEDGGDGQGRHQIVFTLEPEQQAPSILEEEREKHRRRAAKFGADYVEPGKARRELLLESRKERFAKEGFATGIDVFSEEEVAKRNARAARFNIQEPQSLVYKPDEDEVAKARRAKKFGSTYQPVEGAMMDMDLFEERKEVGKDVERRKDAIYLYGVDVMSTRDVLHYFTAYGPSFVEWINDSSCNVLFRDEFSAKRAMAGLGRPLPADEMTGESSEGLDPTDPANMPYFWHKGKDFEKPGVPPVHLIFRMATVEDVRPVGAPRVTRELWKQAPGGPQGNKSRRGQYDQQAGGGRRGQRGPSVDADGDVDMDAGGEEGGGGGGWRGGRGRRRKGRAADGSTRVMDEDGMDWQEEGAHGEHGQGGEAAGAEGGEGAGAGEAGMEQGGHGQGGHHRQRARLAILGDLGAGEAAAAAAEGAAGGASTPVVDVLLRRIVHARRAQGSKQHHGGANAEGAAAEGMEGEGGHAHEEAHEAEGA